MALKKLQIGKNGLTKEFIENLRKDFENTQHIRISVLKSAGHDKASVKDISEKILKELGTSYTCKIIGFTLALRKWRQARR